MLSYVNTFVDVRDVAHAVVLALSKGRSGERYIVTAWNIGMVEFTRKILQVTGKKAWVVPVSGPFVFIMDGFLWLLDLLKLNPGIRRLSQMNVDKACSNRKIRHEMGWGPAYTLEQSIADSFSGKRK
jgi:nucleoside-diphosphate-sugar epimerase